MIKKENQKIYLSRGASTVHQLYVHLVFVIKRRKDGFITPQMLQVLRRTFDEVCVQLECKLLSCNSDGNHVHVLVKYPPKVAISLIANRMKGFSSYTINDLTADKGGRENGPRRLALWTPSYFAASVGYQTVKINTEYVENQGKGQPKAA